MSQEPESTGKQVCESFFEGVRSVDQDTKTCPWCKKFVDYTVDKLCTCPHCDKKYILDEDEGVLIKQVYCHTCSQAGGADRAIYHNPLACD